MSRSRDIAKEIMEISSRRPSGNFYIELETRLSYLKKIYENRKNMEKELWRYFPISIVSCSEAFFRHAIKKLIDAGEPYLTNSKGLLDSRKTDFGILKALHGRSITIGDIVAHLVPINSLDQISKVMSGLLDYKFLDKIPQTHDRLAVEIEKKPKEAIISDKHTTFRFVARTFELRHIFCHEFANKYELDEPEIEQCFEHFCTFLAASKEHIQQTLFPNEPLTLQGMNEDIAKKYEDEKNKMDSLNQRILRDLTEKQITEFRKANKAWEDFIFASARVEGFQCAEGEKRPLVEGNVLVHLTKERIKNLEELIKKIGEL